MRAKQRAVLRGERALQHGDRLGPCALRLPFLALRPVLEPRERV